MSKYEHLDNMIEKLDKSPRFKYATDSKELKLILSQLTDHLYVELVGFEHETRDTFSVEVHFQFTLSRSELEEA